MVEQILARIDFAVLTMEGLFKQLLSHLSRAHYPSLGVRSYIQLPWLVNFPKRHWSGRLSQCR